MIGAFFKIAWRNFYKHKYYSLINVFGLGLGMCCTLVIFLFISYHLSFDKYHANAQRLYRVVTDLHLPDGSTEYDQGAPYVLGPMLKQQTATVANEAPILDRRTFTVAVNDQQRENLFYEFENVAFTDNNWFKLFTYNWKAGDKNVALTNPYTAVITSKLAKKYFNTDDAVGKTIKLDNKHNVTITGVLADNPANTDVQANMFLSISSVKSMYPDDPKTFWTDIGFISSKGHVYVLLRDEHQLKSTNELIKVITKDPLKAYGGVYQFHLQPLAEVHFDSRYSGTISKTLLWILAIVGAALIIIACVNFINMATAQSLTRAKEVGTRMVLGSSKSGIFWQFIIETFLITFVAALMALLGLLLFLPVLNSWLQLPLAVNGILVVFLGVMVVVVVLTAGVYPALVLSGFKPVNALRNIVNQSSPSSKISRSVLIISQNAIAQVFIVATLIITLQVNFLKNADLGFNKNAVIMLPLPDRTADKLSYLRNELSNYTGVKSLSFCYRAPSSTSGKGGFVGIDHKPTEKFAVRSIIGDDAYIKTFNIKILAGRSLTPGDTNNYVINKQLMVKLGFKKPEDAIGHQLADGDFGDKAGTIVGVMNDFHNHSLTTEIEPAVLGSKAELYEYAAVKIDGVNQREVIDNIKQKWQQVYPHNVFEYHFLDQQIAQFYQKEDMISRLIRVSATVAIFISCLGMLGLVSLITVQRTKEIGIRKVLGASVSSIIGLITTDFVKLIAIALIISTPLAWWMMHSWLQGFAYRIAINWWLFGLSTLTALFIACITIVLQSLKAAVANPVNSIRNG